MAPVLHGMMDSQRSLVSLRLCNAGGIHYGGEDYRSGCPGERNYGSSEGVMLKGPGLCVVWRIWSAQRRSRRLADAHRRAWVYTSGAVSRKWP
jgi:hypothetical protein